MKARLDHRTPLLPNLPVSAPKLTNLYCEIRHVNLNMARQHQPAGSPYASSTNPARFHLKVHEVVPGNHPSLSQSLVLDFEFRTGMRQALLPRALSLFPSLDLALCLYRSIARSLSLFRSLARSPSLSLCPSLSLSLSNSVSLPPPPECRGSYRNVCGNEAGAQDRLQDLGEHPLVIGSRCRAWGLLGYLAHKKQRPPKTLQ